MSDWLISLILILIGWYTSDDMVAMVSRAFCPIQICDWSVMMSFFHVFIGSLYQ